MLLDFFYTLRNSGIPVSVKEFLCLLEAVEQDLMAMSVDQFYYIARLIMIKDETLYDKFDKAFANYFNGIHSIFDKNPEIPLDWLEKRMQREFSDEQKAALQKFGYDKLLNRLNELLKEQKERHAGGNKWIGSAGTSAFGNGGYHPEGIRIGGKSEHRSAVKVWQERAFRDYDKENLLGTRTIQLALRRLRKLARQGAAQELALDKTIQATASNAGFLSIQMQAERKNNLKVLMLFDVGGTMDDHIMQTEQLFAAASSEFKHMDFLYFHNCVYDYLWKNNQRRTTEKFPTWDVLHTYPSDTRLIIVGDASMSPYELLEIGGSVEYANNQETGAVWLNRLTQHFPGFVWLNPEPESIWPYRQSITIVRQIMQQRMFPMTLTGLEQGMRLLSK